MALVSWESVCQPRSCGGLGFRQLRDQNTSFMLKLDYNIVSTSNALWVRVLRSKYSMKEEKMEIGFWGILDGLVLFQGRGYQRVMIQIDFLEVVMVLQYTPLVASSSTLIRPSTFDACH
ncbi:hypothetical protein Godav_006685, partial [Gossypium davidsonii]|nr:hypothetical protein [Gossypium davidsonii]MBA0656484.1 hypothetical protein [Gossypium klotzschianum]